MLFLNKKCHDLDAAIQVQMKEISSFSYNSRNLIKILYQICTLLVSIHLVHMNNLKFMSYFNEIVRKI